MINLNENTHALKFITKQYKQFYKGENKGPCNLHKILCDTCGYYIAGIDVLKSYNTFINSKLGFSKQQQERINLEKALVFNEKFMNSLTNFCRNGGK